ncbi:MAG: hypothetical protein KR126chlam1_01364 [Chlamydiae bacterium]|nr:hypothetical protein [Chlamydiota bacterium]
MTSFNFGIKLGVIHKQDEKDELPSRTAFIEFPNLSFQMKKLDFSLGVGVRLMEKHATSVVLNGEMSASETRLSNFVLDYLYIEEPTHPELFQAGLCSTIGVGQNWGRESRTAVVKGKDPIDYIFTWQHEIE